MAWSTNNLYTAKLVAWGWADFEEQPASVVSPKDGVFETVTGEKEDALFVARLGDPMPEKPPE